MIRREREFCADERVLASGSSPSDYVRSLAALAEGPRAGRPALGAAGGSLRDRIQTELQIQELERNRQSLERLVEVYKISQEESDTPAKE